VLGRGDGPETVDVQKDWFKRLVLPALAFKAVVIGGGYATGRELAEFFLPSGPQGGLIGMVLAMVIWSVVCVITFLFARMTATLDYRSFFKSLLGPFGWVFEVAYYAFAVLVLAVFGSAAGAIGHALFGLSDAVGAIVLMTCISLVVAFGDSSVERLFKYVSILLYGTYGVFLVLSVSKFGGLIGTALATPVPTHGWAIGGVTYAGYNIIGAVVILPVVRHFTSNRDAVVAGLVCGPLAMAPAMIFFVCLAAFYPAVQGVALPSDFLLQKLNFPVFHLFFQAMIFAALLESATGFVHAINARIDHALVFRRGAGLTKGMRLAIAAALLIFSVFLATRFGLVELIAKGYRSLSYVFLAIYVLPVMTLGVWRLLRSRSQARGAALQLADQDA
jgi:uncharacterized membrane protein YkvI